MICPSCNKFASQSADSEPDTYLEVSGGVVSGTCRIVVTSDGDVPVPLRRKWIAPRPLCSDCGGKGCPRCSWTGEAEFMSRVPYPAEEVERLRGMRGMRGLRVLVDCVKGKE